MRATHLATLAAVSALALALIPGTASATSSSGITSTTVYQSTVGSTTYTLKQLTIAPGGSTGWHYHDGPVYAVVEKGTLTHSHADCMTDGVYSAGAFIEEEPGANDVHIGRNLGTTPVVLDVLYVDPVGDPLAVSVPNPGCDFQ